MLRRSPRWSARHRRLGEDEHAALRRPDWATRTGCSCRIARTKTTSATFVQASW